MNKMHKRRKRAETRKMPNALTLADVTKIMKWPLGSIKTRSAAGEGWTDCILELEPRIRLGGRYNTRRVRYDGRFFIMHNTKRVYLTGELPLKVLESASYVYGLDLKNDIFFNKMLKGY